MHFNMDKHHKHKYSKYINTITGQQWDYYRPRLVPPKNPVNTISMLNPMDNSSHNQFVLFCPLSVSVRGWVSL